MFARLLRVTKWFLIVFMTLVLAVIALLWLQWSRAACTTQITTGTVVTDRAPGPVTITRDAYGVPHIEAATLDAVLFGLGFAHAQDRYWQMDLTRRSATGRISELLGAVALPRDVLMRVYDFRRTAESTLASMSPEARALVQAYSDGVAAWLSSSAYRRPAEYVLTFQEPESWGPVDTVLIHKMLWLTLSGNAGQEHQSMRLRRPSLGAPADELLSALYPAYGSDAHVSTEWADMARSLGLPLAPSEAVDANTPVRLPGDPSREHSNNWVVGGQHTVSGKPLLANDPHLALGLPGFWYLAHLRVGGRDHIGATVPGLPAIIIGHNGRVAWGITNSSGSDLQDVYVEQLDPADSSRYQTPSGWAQFESRSETFQVRFGSPLTRDYLRSRHGPVFHPTVFTDPPPPIDFDREAVALAWTLYEGPDRSIEGALGAFTADTVPALAETLRKIDGPSVNYVMADTEDNIGFLVTGRVPVRQAQGAEAPGYHDGSDAAHDWQGMIPKSMTPYVINPESGKVVNANAKAVPFEYPYYRGRMSVPTSRQQRIQNLVDATAQHSLESFAAIQLDHTAHEVETAMPKLMAVLEGASLSPAATEARALLATWDHAWSAEAAAPLIFATWIRDLRAALLADELASVWTRFRGYDVGDVLQMLDGGSIAAFCDDIGTAEHMESCTEVTLAAFEQTTQSIVAVYGKVAAARWGAVSPDQFDHMGLGALPVIGPRLSRQTQRGAGYGAPNVGPKGSAGFPATGYGAHGPGLRFVIDMADPARARFMIAGGQSGHFQSPHYDDLLRLWERGEYITISPDLDAIVTPQVLELRPR
ncbi:MAG: penicillin acylase family protein [Pseudomonadota bacterium]